MRNTRFAMVLGSLAVVITAGLFWVARSRAQSGPPKLSSFDPQVKALLARMTLDEKIGQMTQPDELYVKDPADVRTLMVGSVLSGGDSDPREGNSLAAWTGLYDRLQEQALHTRLRIPLLYGVDAVHGHNNVLGAVIFPHNIGLGCTRDPALVEKAARITAAEVRASGINWTFAPGVMVPRDIRWGRTYEGFSEDPEIVKVMAAAAVRGFQGRSLADPLSILACAKHFAGDGGTTWGTGYKGAGLDQGDTRVDEATLRRVHLQGYLAAIDAGVGSIMPSYSSWNGLKSSGNQYLLTQLLKQEMGFEGFLISDYNALDQVAPDFKTGVEKSINAGMDMAMVPERYREFIADLKELVGEGKVPMARIDDAVTRILRVKFAMGLMDRSRSPLADRELQKSFGSPEHRAVARQAVRESMVLLKNENHTLPVASGAKRILVAGGSADNLGNQCGGWTIDWQGRGGPVTTGGTTILAAIRDAVSSGAQVTYSPDGTHAAGADIGIVVIGEKPYAEFEGDRADLSLAPDDVRAVENVKAAGVPVVVVVLSGRPIILGSVRDQADAVLAAWLPGSEGGGVADVLFGKYKPAGKLSFSWPRSMAGIPAEAAERSDILFPLGYGLTY